MNYEQKYKEALEKARQLCAYPTTKPFISDLQDLFPELKESKVGKPNGGIVSEDFNEGDGFYKVNLAYLSKEQVEEIESLVKKWNPESEDGRIRKEITDYIKSKFENSCSPTPSKNILGNWIAWLEKQDKQKSCGQMEKCAKCQFVFTGYCNGTCILKNKEPKFNVGDWIIFNGLTLYIKEVVQGYYRTITIDNVPNSYDWDIDNAARLWTIKEVKNGDVLKEDSCVFIVERINPNGTARVYCCLFDDGEFDLTGSTLGFDIDSTHPATKEQRDLLFQKIKETHHKWDADKKELIKL